MAGTRIAIQDAMRNLLTADSALAVLTGASVDDLRVYPGFDKPKRTLDVTRPGFVVVFPVTGRTPVLDREAKRYQVSCVALKLSTAQRMADRVDALLHKQSLSATGWTDVVMHRVSETPTYSDEDGAFQNNLDFEVQVY